MQLSLGVLSALVLSVTVGAWESPDCACYTETHTAQPTTPCPRLKCGPRPLCILLKETIIPGPNPKCPTTPTVTVPGSCQTTCQRGCGTSFKTMTADKPCLGPLSPITPTPYMPTPTWTSSTRSSTDCYTYTSVPDPQYCPGFTFSTCIRPACGVLKTITLPPKTRACAATPTIVATPSCLNECKSGCETFTSTITASPT